jgi:septum formation protein
MQKCLVLASGSPRRRELLNLLHLPFEVISSDSDESFDPASPPSEIAKSLASMKAEAVAKRVFSERPTDQLVILGADTLVAVERNGVAEILGKPLDAEDARRMLTSLSGIAHKVYTGISLAIVGPDIESHTIADVVKTEVLFRSLSDEMIDAYLATGEPFDKAGAYGIQGYAGAFVESITGDYFNVVGLPVQSVGKMLEQAGIEWWRGADTLSL